MQTILNNIEMDIQELKCLMQAIVRDNQPSLKMVARRNISQMRLRLDALQQWLDECPDDRTTELPKSELPEVKETKTEERVVAPVGKEVVAAETTTTILADRIRPTATLRSSISLNDSFRFARELFGGDAARMNQLLQRLGEASSLDEALRMLAAEVKMDEENEAVVDFVELLKKYFD